MNTSTHTTEKPQVLPEEMFRLATKGDILVCNGKDFPILFVGNSKLGRMIVIKHKGKEIDLYLKESYQSLHEFVPGKGWECFPGSTNFKIKPQKTNL
ncbi:MAG: hypothetical protein ACR2IQ_00240 [Minisyncoccia bacterium]